MEKVQFVMPKMFWVLLAILLSLVALVVGMSFVSIFIPRTCLDGHGSAKFFESKYIPNFENMTVFNMSEIKYIARSYQDCSEFTYQIKVPNNWKDVDKIEFENFIESYNSDCSNCLLVQISGAPLFEVYILNVSTNEILFRVENIPFIYHPNVTLDVSSLSV